MCPRKSPQTQAHHLFNLIGSLLLRHWEAHWYNSPFVALSVSWWRGAPRSEDTHFIRQWREQQKPSLPFVCDAHAEALAAIKAPDSLWMGPDRYWSHRQICREPSFLPPPRQPLISAVSIGTLDIQSPLHLVGQRLWKKKREKKKATSVQANHSFCLYWSFFQLWKRMTTDRFFQVWQ